MAWISSNWYFSLCMLENLKLPQNLIELSNITEQEYPVDKWSGAVVFLVVENSLVLIKRSDTMPSHKGQIGFIGGHKKDGEIDPIVTAKREFFEESNIPSSKIECLGLIHPVWTAKRKIIIPVYAHYKGSADEFLGSVKSNGEWGNLVLVPLSFILNEDIWTRCNLNGVERYSMYFAPLLFRSCRYLYSGAKDPYVLWGASAKMILNFFQKHMDSDNNLSN